MCCVRKRGFVLQNIVGARGQMLSGFAVLEGHFQTVTLIRFCGFLKRAGGYFFALFSDAVKLLLPLLVFTISQL